MDWLCYANDCVELVFLLLVHSKDPDWTHSSPDPDPHIPTSCTRSPNNWRNSACSNRPELISPKQQMTGAPEIEEGASNQEFFWVYNSDSAGEIRLVKVSVLCSSLRAFYSARLWTPTAPLELLSCQSETPVVVLGSLHVWMCVIFLKHACLVNMRYINGGKICFNAVLDLIA